MNDTVTISKTSNGQIACESWKDCLPLQLKLNLGKNMKFEKKKKTLEMGVH